MRAPRRSAHKSQQQGFVVRDLEEAPALRPRIEIEARRQSMRRSIKFWSNEWIRLIDQSINIIQARAAPQFPSRRATIQGPRSSRKCSSRPLQALCSPHTRRSAARGQRALPSTSTPIRHHHSLATPVCVPRFRPVTPPDLPFQPSSTHARRSITSERRWTATRLSS